MGLETVAPAPRDPASASAGGSALEVGTVLRDAAILTGPGRDDRGLGAIQSGGGRGETHGSPIAAGGGRGSAIPAQTRDPAPSVLVGAVSHELRGTLALISGYSQALLHLPLDEETRHHYLERILAATDNLTDLTDQMLDLVVMGNGRPMLRRRPVAIDWLAARLTQDRSQVPDGVAIETFAATTTPLVDVDPVWVSHVLRNLVSNSARHGHARAVRIFARATDEWVVVTVADDGEGIPAEERDQVFDPFYRGRRARESGAEGSGIGLYLCRQLVEAHGGRIWLEEAAAGTAFSFSLPRYGVTPAADPVRNVDARTLPAPKPAAGSGRFSLPWSRPRNDAERGGALFGMRFGSGRHTEP